MTWRERERRELDRRVERTEREIAEIKDAMETLRLRFPALEHEPPEPEARWAPGRFGQPVKGRG
jgi:hypothetical protein